MVQLTKPELRDLILGNSNPKHRLLFQVMLLHGLRVSEAINLKGANIRDGYLTVQRLKNSEKTIQPFNESDDTAFNEAPALRTLAATLAPDEKLFNITRDGVYKLMQRVGTRAGIPRHKLHPHALKHTMAKAAISKGIEYTQKFLGHKSMASTGKYLKVDDEEASAAMKGLF